MSTARNLESWQLEPLTFETRLEYDNFPLWSARVEFILKSRGLWGLADGTEVAPEAGAEIAKLERWKMRDACAMLQLVTNVPDKWLWIFRRTTTLREAWVALQQYFQPHSTFKQSLALRKFTSSRVSEDGDVRAHVLRMGDLWQNVLDTGAYKHGSPESDYYFVAVLLDSLPPSWSVFATTWDQTPDESKASGTAIVGHILDRDAWNRGRAEAHKRRSAGQRKPRSRSSKIVEE